jgi:antigen 43
MGMGTCFMSGARIRAARGDIAVEMIAPGEAVVVMRDGKPNLEPVKWVGHTYMDIARHARPEEAAPIRFRTGAIANDQPERDLVVSPEHCLVIDGLCVPAKLLVNGGSVVSERDHLPFTYHHIELEQHGILLAENTPAESYLNTGNRSWFDNAEDPRQLHPDFTVNADSARWLTDACAPLAKIPDEVAPIWQRLAERSAEIGYPIPAVLTVDEPEIHLLADGKVVGLLSNHDSRYTFVVPAGVTSVALMSRFSIPSDQMIPGQRDTRRLGVRVDWISIRCGGNDTIIPADHPGLDQGWNDFEKDATTAWRWTDGAATIPWENITNFAIVTIRCSPAGSYPIHDDRTQLVA